MYKDAVFSRGRKYRYALWRIWDDSRPCAMFIALNPSTADEVKNDPTVIRCQEYARRWGYGGLCMANIFAYRSTDPEKLKQVRDPVGPQTDTWLKKLAKQAGIVVAAWGNYGTYRDRDKEVIKLLGVLHCLGVNKNGQPAHPLRLSADLKPMNYRPTNRN